ncbi:MAG: hypothetical protein RIB67_00070 [Miltoncostaeaceae bacterium]
MSGDPLSPRYDSGDDVILRAGDAELRFRRDDFADRVTGAARRLGLIGPDAPPDDERADLVALAAHGAVAGPRSELGARLEALRPHLTAGGRDMVHWLRRLVVRGAWIDQHVRDGALVPAFEQGSGFSYRSPVAGAPVSVDTHAPDWSAHVHRRTTA